MNLNNRRLLGIGSDDKYNIMIAWDIRILTWNLILMLGLMNGGCIIFLTRRRR